MSIAAAVARVSEIEGMLAQAPPAAPTSTPATSFDQQLQQASAAGPGASLSPAVAGTGSGGDGPFKAEIDAAAQKYGIDPALLRGLIRQESNFDPNARSGAGAVGLSQLMPGTAASLGVTNPLDPAQSIDAGARYLRQQLDAFGGDVQKALAAYNAGPGAVKRYGGVPPYGETQNYVRQVMAYADQYRSQSQPVSATGGAGALQNTTV
jgi:soluble lytic murein transglycosylase-like protein